MLKTLFSPTAIFNKLFKKSENYITIRKRTYNKALHSLVKSSWHTPHTSTKSSTLFWYCPRMVTTYYSSSTSKIVIHITDEQLAKLIYKAIKSEVKLLNELCDLRFVVIESEQKAVFAVFTDTYYHNTSNSLLARLVEIADEFCNKLSMDDDKVYCNYSRLYCYANDIHWIVALFYSLVFKPVDISDEYPSAVATILLNKLGYSYTLDVLYKHIQESYDSPYYMWLRKGVIDKSTLHFSSSMPLDIEINILKYVLDKTHIYSIHDFFKSDKSTEAIKECHNLSISYVIDEDLYIDSLTYIKESSDYVIYADNSGKTFAKIKNNDNVEKLIEAIKSLNSSNEIIYTNFIYSPISGMYMYFPSKSNLQTLRETINCKKNDFEFSELLSIIDRWGCHKSTFKKYCTIKNANPLDCLSIFKPSGSLICTDPLSISFNINNSTESLDYKLLMMMVIDEYMKYNSISVNNIYSLGIIKTFQPEFTNALIEYLKHGVYNTTLQNNVFNGSSFDQVEFVENISIKSVKLLSHISLFKDYTPSTNLAIAIEKRNKREIAKGLLPIDDFLKNYDTHDLVLDKNNINYFLSKPAFSKIAGISPHKLLISRDVTLNGSYKIIGIIWNHGSLCNVIEVIKSKKMNHRQVYTFISCLLKIYDKWHCSIKDLSPTNALLVDMMSFDPVFLETYTSYDNVKLDVYYDYIIRFLISKANFNTNYTIFNYSDMVLNNNSSSNYKAINYFKDSAAGIAKCKYHDLYHLKHELCPECKVLYELVNISKYSKNQVYDDSVASFLDASNFTIYSFKDPNLEALYFEETKIGIENKMFVKFFGIKPLKLIQSPSRSISHNIMYSACDFSKVIGLDSFRNLQRLKVILVIYKKLLPYILDSTFITSSSKIFETMFMHKEYKGELLIPNLTLMECSVIMSNDTKLKEAKTENTKKIFADFLISYIMADEYLAEMINSNTKEIVDIVQDIKQLTFSQDLIKICLDLYKKYCITHKKYFPTSRTFCVECEKDGIKADDSIFKDKSYFQRLNSSNAAFDGGEADIFNYDNSHVQKIFKPHVDLDFKSKILAKALEKNHLIKAFNDAHEDIKIVSATKLLYKQDGNEIELKGFIQEFISSSYKISSLKEKEFVKKQGYSRKDIVELLIKLCKGIEFLHSIGGFIGDLNGGNVLIKDKSVYIIDIDGMSFDNVKNCVYTNMYIYPPSAESKNITKEDDWYSLAVQAFYYLTYSHPFRGICDDKNIPVNETERMKLGISILGNHNIIAPSISIGWEFMSTDLYKYFLNTFEGKKRESMLDVLKSYYSYLEKCEFMFSEELRENHVFVNVNPDIYIDTNYNLIYKEKILTNIRGYSHVSLSRDSIYVTFRYDSYYFDFKNDKEYKLNKVYHNLLSIFENNIYYSSSDKCELFVDTIDPETKQVSTHSIRKSSKQAVLRLRAEEKDKIVFVENNSYKHCYDIYCNFIKVYSVAKKEFNEDVTIRIKYDEISKKHLVIFREERKTIGVIIGNKSDQISTFTLKKTLPAHLHFYRNTLYYASTDSIYFYNINTQILRSIECKYATNESLVYRQDNKFIIVNAKEIYVYEKS